MTKRIILLFSLVITTLLSYGRTADLRINGEAVNKTLQRIHFEGDSAVVHFSDGSYIHYRMDLVEVWFNTSGTALEETEIRLLSTLVGDELIVECGSSTALVQVYDLQGRLQMQTTTLPDQALRWNVSTLRQGMYILRVERESIRFIKQ